MVEVSGEVTDGMGRPLTGVELRFEGSSSFTAPYEFVDVDSVGRYSVSLYPGIYIVQVLPRAGFGYPLWTREVTFDASHARLSIVVPAAIVTGSVKDPSGALMDSGYVYVSGEPDGSGSFYASKRFESGTFEFMIPYGTYRFAVDFLTGTGFPTARTGDLSVRSDTTILLEVKGDPLSGTVRARGEALARARIIAEAEGVFCSARADDAGGYLMYLPPQAYRFRIQPTQSWILPRFTTLQAISGPSTLDFDLDGALWSGLVQDGAGQPRVGLVVTAWMFADRYQRGAVDTTDASGAFRLLLELGREYSLQVNRPETNELEYYHPEIVANADTTFEILIEPPKP